MPSSRSVTKSPLALALGKGGLPRYGSGQASSIVTQAFTYDTDGIKVTQTETVDSDADGTADSTTSTEYLNDKQNHTGYSQVLEERADDGTGTRTTTYTIGHDVIAQFSAAVGAMVLLTDAHGSTRAVADAAAQVQQEYLYDAYGALLNMQPANALTSLLYSGEQFNPVAGLQYLRARWYDPQSGRFTRMDPYSGNVRDPLGLHKYTYANGNPVMGVDPSGNFVTLVSLLVTVYSEIKLRVPEAIEAVRAKAWAEKGIILAYAMSNAIVNMITSDNVKPRILAAVFGFMAGAVGAYISLKRPGLGSGLTTALTAQLNELADGSRMTWKKFEDTVFLTTLSVLTAGAMGKVPGLAPGPKLDPEDLADLYLLHSFIASMASQVMKSLGGALGYFD